MRHFLHCTCLHGRTLSWGVVSHRLMTVAIFVMQCASKALAHLDTPLQGFLSVYTTSAKEPLFACDPIPRLHVWQYCTIPLGRRRMQTLFVLELHTLPGR